MVVRYLPGSDEVIMQVFDIPCTDRFFVRLRVEE